MVKYYNDDQTPEIPAPGGDYSSATPHSAKVSDQIFTAPSSLPTGNPKPAPHGAFDFMDAPAEPTEP
jgi:hypothetical protein